MEIRVLGALEVIDAGGPVQVSAAKQRRLLAALLIRAGQTCPPDLLIDAVWDGSPPWLRREVASAIHLAAA
jgi:DNA-binding SARP family transcriptional activator